jgi:AP2-like factor (ANT lineage)
MTSSGSGVQNMSRSSIAVGGSGWLGFSPSPQVAAAAAGSGIVDVGGHQHVHHGGLYYHHDAVASSPTSFYFGGADNVAPAANGGYYNGISALPLKSDGSLCIVDAFRRSDQEHHGNICTVPVLARYSFVYQVLGFLLRASLLCFLVGFAVCAGAEVSASPKLEDFLGAGPAMALSLDNSSYYYGGHGHALDHGAGDGQQHHLPYAMMPAPGGQDVYYDAAHAYAHAAMLEEQAAIVAAGWMTRGGSGYDVDTGSGEDGAGAIVPAGQGESRAQLHPLSLSMSSGSQSSCVTMQQPPAVSHAYAGEYVARTTVASKKRCAGAGQSKQPVAHRKCIDTFGQRTSQYRGVTR